MKTVVFRGSRAYVKPEALALSLLEDGALLMSSPAVKYNQTNVVPLFEDEENVVGVTPPVEEEEEIFGS